MGLRDTEGIDYRSSASEGLLSFGPDKSFTKDEEEYSTLKSVHIVLKEAIAALYKDFNAFKITEGVPRTTALADLERQISGKQIAYDILMPTLDAITSSLETIDAKYKEQ